jgi:predicted transcriptional regulator
MKSEIVKTTSFNFRLPRAKAHAIRVIAQRLQITPSAVIRMALAKHLKGLAR